MVKLSQGTVASYNCRMVWTLLYLKIKHIYHIILYHYGHHSKNYFCTILPVKWRYNIFFESKLHLSDPLVCIFGPFCLQTNWQSVGWSEYFQMCHPMCYIWMLKNRFYRMIPSERVIDLLSTHDALKHHFTSQNIDFIFLQLGVLERKFPWNWFTDSWQLSLIFKAH